MGRSREDVTEAELAILERLWRDGAATIRQLTNLLYPDGRSSSYATVQKLLERLEGKGFVARDRTGSIHRFSAAVARDDLIGRRLQSLAESLCGGSMVPLLSHLAESQPWNETDRKLLLDLIDRLDTDGESEGPGVDGFPGTSSGSAEE